MAVYYLNKNSEAYYQSLESEITINGITKSVRIELRFLEKTNKWYLSMFDNQSGEAYFRYVPAITCVEDTNDLIAPFYYKGVGSILCLRAVDEPSSTNPQEKNLRQFNILWGDDLVQ